MSHVTALMYHVLYDGQDEWDALDHDERPYAVSVSAFNQHLDTMEKAGISILDPGVVLKEKNIEDVSGGVILTFDDGHDSFYRYAYRILKERGYRAIFFITTDLIEQRDDFCSWDNLAEMAQDHFMIQAHGKSHRFLPDLDDITLELELRDPIKFLEQHTGQKVFSMSFPGGRFQQREIQVGQRIGYEIFFTSQVGIISDASLQKSCIFSRVPIKNGMNLKTFLALAQGRAPAIWIRKIGYQCKLLLKLLLGNRFYHDLYRKLFN